MWKCPKCGRTFKNINQDHYCGEAPKTIEEYISRQPEAGYSGKNILEYAHLLEKVQSDSVRGFQESYRFVSRS